MRWPSAEPRDLLRGPAGAGAAARRRRRRPPRPPSRRGPRRPGARSRGRGRSPAARARCRRGRSGRRPARGRPARSRGPRSRTVSSPSCRRTSTTLPGGLHFAALSSRLRDGAVQPRGDALHERGLELGRERDVRRVAAGTLDRDGDEPVEPHVLGLRRLGLVVAGELDEVADQRGQLLQLRDEIRAQPVAVAGVGRTAAGEHLEVGPQRGERRAQLVRGVGDELALRPLRALERLEHRVERGRQARDLVIPAGRDPPREVARAGHVLRRLGELGHRPDRRAGGEPGEERGEHDPAEREHAEPPAQRRERAVGLGQ